jgi:hypothetical protein
MVSEITSAKIRYGALFRRARSFRLSKLSLFFSAGGGCFGGGGGRVENENLEFCVIIESLLRSCEFVSFWRCGIFG